MFISLNRGANPLNLLLLSNPLKQIFMKTCWKGKTNPYTLKPGWIKPDSKYNTFYYSTYTYPKSKTQNGFTTSTTSTNPLPIQYKNRTYIEDEYGGYSCYLTVKDERSFNIYDMKDELILYLVINHRGDWRIFDGNWIYIKTIFVETEK